jgi:hypothetical protein
LKGIAVIQIYASAFFFMAYLSFGNAYQMYKHWKVGESGLALSKGIDTLLCSFIVFVMFSHLQAHLLTAFVWMVGLLFCCFSYYLICALRNKTVVTGAGIYMLVVYLVPAILAFTLSIKLSL